MELFSKLKKKEAFSFRFQDTGLFSLGTKTQFNNIASGMIRKYNTPDTPYGNVSPKGTTWHF